jgi:hypothetical protein
MATCQEPDIVGDVISDAEFLPTSITNVPNGTTSGKNCQVRRQLERNHDPGRSTPELDGKLQPGCDWRMEGADELARRLFVIIVSAKDPR